MDKILKEKCQEFLLWSSGGSRQEFADKFCHGQDWGKYAKESPDDFIKDVLSFSLTHLDESYFQYKATQHIGNETVRRQLLSEISGKKGESIEMNHLEPKKSSGPFSEKNHVNQNTMVQSVADRSAAANHKRPTVTFVSYMKREVLCLLFPFVASDTSDTKIHYTDFSLKKSSF